MYERREARLLDEFVVFLKASGMMAMLDLMERSAVPQVRIPTMQGVLRSLLNVLVGGQSLTERPRVRFRQVAVMDWLPCATRCGGLDQPGRCPTSHQEEAGTAQPATFRRRHQHTESSADGRALQSGGAVSGELGLLAGERIVARDGSMLETPRTSAGAASASRRASSRSKGNRNGPSRRATCLAGMCWRSSVCTRACHSP